MSESLFPLFVYLYNAEGRYSRPTRIENKDALENIFRGPIKTAIAEKRQVRITDTGDLLVFHSENGRIIYDGQTLYPSGREV